MASDHTPDIRDTIDSTELTVIQPSRNSSSFDGSKPLKDHVLELSTKDVAEAVHQTVQQRSTFRTITVIAALFVSDHFI